MFLSIVKRATFNLVMTLSLGASIMTYSRIAIGVQSPLSSAQAAPLFLTFEQRLLASYSLLAQGQGVEHRKALAARLEQQLSREAAAGVQIVHVENFEQFLTKMRGDWPNTHSLDLDLKLIESRPARGLLEYRSESPRVQRQIDTYLERQQSYLREIVKKNSGQADVDISGLKWLSTHQAKSLALTQLLWLSSDEKVKLIEAAMEKMEPVLAEQVKEFDKIGERIAESRLGAQSDPMQRVFIQTLISQYFARLGEASKKTVLGSLLGEAMDASELRRFEVMVQNSGPQLQKLLQVVARQGSLGQEMTDVFKRLESSVKPVPWVLVQELLEQEKANYKFTYFERSPLGVGSMAQVHRAKVRASGRDESVVVRFIKPNIENRVMEDHRILMEVAEILDGSESFKRTGAPKLTPIIQDITNTVRAELDQRDTIERQKAAAKVYEQKHFIKPLGYKTDLEIHVPKVFEGSSQSQFMVQEMVFGKKLDKVVNEWKAELPDLNKQIIEKVAYVWVQEVMFGSGFYHSDLHQGNFMVEVTEPLVRVNILDYGMGGRISESMQKDVILLGAGLDLKRADLISQAFWAVSDKAKNQVSETEFKKQIEKKLGELKKTGKSLSTSEWTAFAMDAGVGLPYEFVSLNRGMVIINKLLQDSGSEKTVSSLAKTLALENPLKVYRALVRTGALTHGDLVKLGWLQIRGGGHTQDIPAEIRPSVAPLKPGLCQGVFL